GSRSIRSPARLVISENGLGRSIRSPARLVMVGLPPMVSQHSKPCAAGDGFGDDEIGDILRVSQHSQPCAAGDGRRCSPLPWRSSRSIRSPARLLRGACEVAGTWLSL